MDESTDCSGGEVKGAKGRISESIVICTEHLSWRDLKHTFISLCSEGWEVQVQDEDAGIQEGSCYNIARQKFSIEPTHFYQPMLTTASVHAMTLKDK